MYFTRYAKLATCNLNQWALDFVGNKERIMESIQIAKKMGCSIRLGPELEITGYGCEDHFLELDTVNHSWEILAEILETDVTNDILCSIGMPIIHRDILFNCTVILLNKKIIVIRPKMSLADDGNYREGRYFTAWNKTELEEFSLPKIIKRITGQNTTFIGNPIIQCKDTEIGIETCEELWQPNSPNIQMGLEGVEIFLNNSGSHHQLRKLDIRIKLVTEATQKNGGVYLYSNQRGCDGGRLYFDGACMIALNGNLMKIGSQFSLKDVEVVSCIVDLDLVRSMRVAFKSRAIQAGTNKRMPRIQVDYRVAKILNLEEELAKPIRMQDVLYSPEEEISLGPACYLYDYLRRSGGSGYFLPLSGGADSSAVAVIVYNIGFLLYQAIVQENDNKILQDLRKIVKNPEFTPKSIQEIVGKIFFTCYMGSNNSSEETKLRAGNLAKEIGANHFDVNISNIFESFKTAAEKSFGFEPKFLVHGGTAKEDLALQNIQARSRMVLSYLMSQLIPVSLKIPGFILVLSAANLDEGLRGYMTKYDCSSADINPIGSLSKIDLKRFLFWSIKNRNLKSIESVVNATPTAELRPLDVINGNVVQNDEEDMGMSYVELSQFGTLRKINRNGPFSMFNSLLGIWKNISSKEIAEKVKRFFRFYAINRHKMTVLTPSVHAESYSNDDNRYDLRPFIYPINFEHQFKAIDEKLAGLSPNKL